MTLKSIPQDFPCNDYQCSLAGAQPKIAMIEVNRNFYTEGNAPQQLLENFLMCEDLAQQGLAYCKRKIDDGTVPDPNSAMIRLFSGLQSKDWCTNMQKIWIVNRVATLGNWPQPQL